MWAGSILDPAQQLLALPLMAALACDHPNAGQIHELQCAVGATCDVVGSEIIIQETLIMEKATVAQNGIPDMCERDSTDLGRKHSPVRQFELMKVLNGAASVLQDDDIEIAMREEAKISRDESGTWRQRSVNFAFVG
jgi:hypothetical protein